jgi:hypothetical protein
MAFRVTSKAAAVSGSFDYGIMVQQIVQAGFFPFFTFSGGAGRGLLQEPHQTWCSKFLPPHGHRQM